MSNPSGCDRTKSSTCAIMSARHSVSSSANGLAISRLSRSVPVNRWLRDETSVTAALIASAVRSPNSTEASSADRVIVPVYPASEPSSSAAVVDLPEPDSPTMAVRAPGRATNDTWSNAGVPPGSTSSSRSEAPPSRSGSDSSSYRYPTASNVTVSPWPSPGRPLWPRSGSGVSSSAKIRLVEVMPFIATWKYEPNCRNGRKKLAERNTTAIAPAMSMPPSRNCQTATPIPAAVPPYATASIAVSERNWICSTRIVITRNASAFSSMSAAARSSASKAFNVSIPCIPSRNAAPISVYLPQYFLNARAALIATTPTTSTISGAHASSTTAAGTFTGSSTANSVTGANTA